MEMTKLFSKPLLFFLLVLCLIVIGFHFYQLRHRLVYRLAVVPDHSLVEVNLGGKRYKLEVVNQPTSITRGLSGRRLSQVRGDGMIFVLPKKQIAHFWMKDMAFPLDFYWLLDQQIVAKTKNVSPPRSRQPLKTLPVIKSPRPVNLVVEMPVTK